MDKNNSLNNEKKFLNLESDQPLLTGNKPRKSFGFLKLKKSFLTSSSTKLHGWKLFFYVIGLISIFLVMVGLIILSIFYNGDKWMTLEDLNPQYGLYFRSQVLYEVACILAGIGIPIVGCSMQITTRNKLAGPTTLGFYPLIYMGTLLSQLSVSNNGTAYGFAFLLSLLVVIINFLVVRGKPGKQTFKSILIGFVINAVITGSNFLIITYSPAKGNAIAWMADDFGVLTNQRIYISTALILIFTIVLLFLIPYFNIIQKDYIIAKTLGIKVDLIYWVVAFCAIVITVSSVLIIGGAILLGIVAPHLVRILFRTDDNKVILPFSAIFGVFLLSMSSWVSKAAALNGIGLNVNFFTALVSIPVFIFVLKGSKRTSSI